MNDHNIYTCPECERLFPTPNARRLHLEREHTMPEIEPLHPSAFDADIATRVEAYQQVQLMEAHGYAYREHTLLADCPGIQARYEAAQRQSIRFLNEAERD